MVQIPGGGTYRGQWSLILGEQTLVQNETAVAWHNWRCEIGETFRKSVPLNSYPIGSNGDDKAPRSASEKSLMHVASSFMCEGYRPIELLSLSSDIVHHR